MEVMAGASADGAKHAYEAMAPVYDDFTAHYNYESWIGALLGALDRHRLQGRRLLDVACGTGKSFLPMLSRGWEVTGCDISPLMLELARAKVSEDVTLSVADMRELPRFGEFDLAWALTDAINYLLSAEELEGALAGMAGNLAPTGLLLFDLNTLLAFRTFFATTEVIERDGQELVWQGLTSEQVPPSSTCTARLEESRSTDARSALPPHIHRQRHFPEAEVLAALDQAGLECLDVHGHGLDGVLCQPLDEEVHTKAIYVARRRTMQRPRMKQTIQSADGPNGDLYLMRPAVGLDLQIENPSENDRALLAALDGTRTPEELSESFGVNETYKALSQLEEFGVLEDAADDELIPAEIRARYDRQLRYFSDVSEGPPASECQRRLKEARVAVLGVGGLGGWSALALAGCGIGEMLLLDFDRVELNNLNRQVLYAVDDVGRLKVEAAAERLGAFDPEMRIEVSDERLGSKAAVAAAIEGYDVVIDAVDWPALDIERWVNSACFSAGIPFIAMSHFPPVARVGPFYVPGKTGCCACQEIAYRREYPLYDLATEQQRAKPSPAATLGAACALIGGQVALDIMHYLTGLAEPSTLGMSHIFDLRTMEAKHELVVREPGCPVCGDRELGKVG